MRKPAPADHPLLNAVRERWSPIAFDANQPVESDKLLTVLEAARWASSSQNEQPWAFIVGDTTRAPETWHKIFDLLADGNKAWAHTAPVLILTLEKLSFDRNGQANPTALHDVGMAVANLLLQATELSLYTHQMGGYDRAKARTVFAVPDAYAPVAVIALGYIAPAEVLEEKLRARHANPERARKPLPTLVFSGAGAFGEPSPLVETPK